MEKTVMMVLVVVSAAAAAATGVLDPSLYLSPGPPLAPAGEASPQQRWARPLDALSADKARATRDAHADDLLVLPLKKGGSEVMAGAETFWSGYRPSVPAAYVVPVSYAGYAGYAGYDAAAAPAGALAGGGYGSYGTGGFGGYGAGGSAGYGAGGGAGGLVGWSGWGNGKWGHYGSG